MTKQEFSDKLRKALAGLPKEETEERVSFYCEMIEDRMEEGASEEEAVAGVGSVEKIAERILSKMPIGKIVKERVSHKRERSTLQILLIVLGFPVWFPLLLAAGVIVLSIYLVIFSLFLSLWAVDLALGACALGGFVLAALSLVRGDLLPALAVFGISVFSAGAAILFYHVCLAATKGLIRLCGKLALAIKKLFNKNERVN